MPTFLLFHPSKTPAARGHAVKRSGSRHTGITGFTLVELLAALAVFSIIILLVGRIFSDTSSAWKSATVRSDQNIAARMALNFMRQELETALINSNMALRLRSTNLQPDKDSTYTSRDWINFASLSHYFDSDPSGPRRDVGLLCYYTDQIATNDSVLGPYNQYVIRRGCYDSPATMYSYGAYKGTAGAWLGTKLSGGEVILENISSFYITLMNTNTPATEISAGVLQSPGITNYPAYADIFIGVLSPEDAKRAGATGGMGLTTEKIRQLEKRYTTRVYFLNSRAVGPGR